MLLVALTLCAAAGALAALGTRAETAAPGTAAPRGRQVRLGVFALCTLGIACGVLHASGVSQAWGPAGVLLSGWVGVRLLTRDERPRGQVLAAPAVAAVGVGLGALLAERA